MDLINLKRGCFQQTNLGILCNVTKYVEADIPTPANFTQNLKNKTKKS